jgi:hypothetical protein
MVGSFLEKSAITSHFVMHCVQSVYYDPVMMNNWINCINQQIAVVGVELFAV